MVAVEQKTQKKQYIKTFFCLFLSLLQGLGVI